MTNAIVGQRQPLTHNNCRELGVMYGRQGVGRLPFGWQAWTDQQRSAFLDGYYARSR